MKKMFVVLLFVLCLAGGLAACGGKTFPPPALSFEKGSGGVAVQLLTFDGETSMLEAVGRTDHESGTMQLSAACFHAAHETAGNVFVYDLPEGYLTLRKREVVDGVLLCAGAAYGVVTDDTGRQKLFALDETLTEYDWTDFYNQALRRQADLG